MPGTSPPKATAAAGAPEEPADGPLAHIPLFSGLSAETQRRLLGLMHLEKFEPHQPVFWMADRGTSFHLLSTGQVEISIPNEEGEEVVLERQGPGGFFGEISLLDAGPRTATVRASVASEIYRLDQADFQAFLRGNPEAAVEILVVMGRRQRASTTALRTLKNVNTEFERGKLSKWQKASDVIATVSASSGFTILHILWFGAWILLNVLATAGLLPHPLAFDPYPFGLLTMVVSLEAIFLSIFVMVSQNRQAERDRLRADLDYQINLKAETEITALARRLERLETHLLGEREEPPAPTPARD